MFWQTVWRCMPLFNDNGRCGVHLGRALSGWWNELRHSPLALLTLTIPSLMTHSFLHSSLMHPSLLQFSKHCIWNLLGIYFLLCVLSPVGVKWINKWKKNEEGLVTRAVSRMITPSPSKRKHKKHQTDIKFNKNNSLGVIRVGAVIIADIFEHCWY